MSADANTASARAFVDEWARMGLREAVVAPGSRSTPPALALAADPRVRLHVHLDERSAAFFALGLAKVSDRPVVVLCTSGTAAANFHPAVLEADHGRVPLLVCTADRPPELRGVGAGQTIDQVDLYGDAVRWFCDVDAPADVAGAGESWRSTAGHAYEAAVGSPPGPVHLNLPYREPLVPTGAPLVDAPGRSDGSAWVASDSSARAVDAAVVDRLAAEIAAESRGVLVAGWGAGVRPETARAFSNASGWPVLADPLSQLRTGPHAVSMYDALLRVDAFAEPMRPRLGLRIGAPLTSKAAGSWLGGADRAPFQQWLVDADGVWLDPAGTAGERVTADAEPLLDAVSRQLVAGDVRHDPQWRHDWSDAEHRARRAVDDLLDGWEEPFEGRIARDVVATLPDAARFFVASSMPVRDVESFAAPREGVEFFANRGVNGIDGFVSTVLGGAAASDVPVVALLGDLCFLHDSNALLGAAQRGIDATLVVVDNDGGGIFSFLPQANAAPEHFEALFGTPHGVDLAALAAVHRIPVTEVEKASTLGPAVSASISGGGVRMVLVRTDRSDNVTRHREVWKAVERSLA